MFLRFFLFLFALYLPCYLAFVIFLKSKNKKFSYHKDTVSFLAASKKPWGHFFNISTFLYGLLSLILPIYVIKTLGVNMLTVFGSLFVGLTGLATMLVGLFPMDKKVNAHSLVSYLAFLNVILTGVTFALIFSGGDLISTIMRLLSIWVVGITLFLAVWRFRNKPNYSFFEWIVFISTIAWNFTLSVSLLMKV